MIILRSRSLIIPNDEYNLGNDYDTNTATRVFQLDRVMEGIDLANLMFKLDLTYADGTSDTLALDSEVTDDKINLTWTVTKNQLHVPGTVVVQIRALNVDGNMKWTSYIGAFFVEASMFGSADYNGKLTEVEQFEVAIKSEKERVQNEKARQDAEAERVQAEAERKPAEEERKTAEAERKSAETVRSNAETARESAETEREKWYNSAKTNFDAAIASGDKAEQIANSLETNVEANMKAAAASATAAAGSASAAAGSANEAKEYSQNWSSLDQRVKKNATDIENTNNNLSDSKKVVQVTTDDHGFSLGYDADNGLYTLVDLTRFYLVSKDDFVIKTYTIAGKEVSAGTTADFEPNIVLSGYTPLGIVGTRLNSYGSVTLVYADLVDNTKARVRVRNNGTASATGENVIIRVLYFKS